ncbi:2199_t:CDS:2 [Ambispora gerdemannii]|uniref:2199_t:CDS:1 n=1 Tax=Ambispora gerdemannii TaxID=144530 RepID=A0A9N9DD92_9GLOM|nr:2199_t:CDS:2 [Ambispora gerdemannii]
MLDLVKKEQAKEQQAELAQKKLAQLSQLLDKIDEVRAINSDEPETWDSDTLYNLVEDLKKALELLEDQKIDEYQSEEEEASEDF